MAYTDAADWLDRFVSAGCRLRIDAAGLTPADDHSRSEVCRAIWSELQGPENTEKWNDVIAEVRLRVGAIVGWTDYPPT